MMPRSAQHTVVNYFENVRKPDDTALSAPTFPPPFGREILSFSNNHGELNGQGPHSGNR